MTITDIELKQLTIAVTDKARQSDTYLQEMVAQYLSRLTDEEIRNIQADTGSNENFGEEVIIL